MKAKKVRKKYPELSLDECTSIVMYTMEDAPREASIYIKMNEALRAKDRSKVRPWRDFIWLLLHALQKLPVMQISNVVRGCKKRPQEMSLDLERGDEITWSAFTSTATSVDVMNAFLGDDGPRTLLQIELTEPVARSIQDFSLFPSENEVLLPPNVCLKFESKFNAGHGLVMMQFKQTETIDALINMHIPAAADSQTASLINQGMKEQGPDVQKTSAENATLTTLPLADSTNKGVKEEGALATKNTQKGSPLKGRCQREDAKGKMPESTDEKDAEGKPAKKRARVGCQIPMPTDMDAMRKLVSSGEIAKLPVPMMKEWLKSQGWIASGRREDLVARIRVLAAAK